MITIGRYGSRNWAVYLNGRLLAVTVYRKGAIAIRDTIANLASALPEDVLASA